jgi:hypothetical protein
VSARRLICIVEGQGESVAVPIIVNRILLHLRRHLTLAADPDRVICTKNGDRITEPHDAARQIGIEFFVQRAAREKPGGILVVVDAEDRCAKRGAGLLPLGVELLERAERHAGSIPVGVAVANRMFEAWFLADFHSLRARNHLPPTARLTSWRTPESLGGCKGRLKELMARSYSETGDQPRFAECISLPLRPAMQRRAPSYWKLFREINRLSR